MAEMTINGEPDLLFFSGDEDAPTEEIIDPFGYSEESDLLWRRVRGLPFILRIVIGTDIRWDAAVYGCLLEWDFSMFEDGEHA